ncbi:MAG: phosphoglycerate dehydrogenase [Sphaerochaetaceae bacterium]
MKRIVSFFGEHNAAFDRLNRETAEYAESLGFEYRWVIQKPFNRESVIEELKNADCGLIDIEPYGSDIFEPIKDRCKLLVRFGVGFDKVDLKAASESHIAVGRTVGANTQGVAEMAMTFMLSSHRKLKENMKLVEDCNWIKDVTNELSGSTIGIAGYGAIGQAVSKLLAGFGCRIIAYDPYPNHEVAERNSVEFVSMEDLFMQSDSITVHMPYSEETHNTINKDLLSLMKPTSVIVNTSRGNIIHEEDLYNVLANHKICGAALDVFATEPLPVSSPLIGLDNCILTPHVSSQTYESLWRIYKMAVDITKEFYDGRTGRWLLNPDYNG